MSILASLHLTQTTNIFIQWPGISPLASHFVAQHIDMAPARGHPTRQRGESPMSKSEGIVKIIDTPSQKKPTKLFQQGNIHPMPGTCVFPCWRSKFSSTFQQGAGGALSNAGLWPWAMGQEESDTVLSNGVQEHTEVLGKAKLSPAAWLTLVQNHWQVTGVKPEIPWVSARNTNKTGKVSWGTIHLVTLSVSDVLSNLTWHSMIENRSAYHQQNSAHLKKVHVFSCEKHIYIHIPVSTLDYNISPSKPKVWGFHLAGNVPNALNPTFPQHRWWWWVLQKGPMAFHVWSFELKEPGAAKCAKC